MPRCSIAILLSMALCLPMLSSTFAAAEETEDLDLNQDVEVTNQGEYQIAVEKTAQMESHGTEAQEDGMTPIEEYKEEFDKRAAMPSEILSGMGYSEEEIAILESYRKGEIPFETAAIATEAALAKAKPEFKGRAAAAGLGSSIFAVKPGDGSAREQEILLYRWNILQN